MNPSIPEKKLTLRTTVMKTSNQVSCELDGETVILQPQSGVYFKINEVGTRIWELLDQPRDIHWLAQTLTEEFEVDPETCQKEVFAFLESLITKKLASS